MNLSRRGSTSTNTETVPRIANYINFFNLRSNSRPTLEELHEPVSRRQNVTFCYAFFFIFLFEINLNINRLLVWILTRKYRSLLATNSDGSKVCSSATRWAFGVLCFSSESRGLWLFQEYVSLQIYTDFYKYDNLADCWNTGQTLIIIAISTFITLMTALSMSAIATNGEIGGGRRPLFGLFFLFIVHQIVFVLWITRWNLLRHESCIGTRVWRFNRSDFCHRQCN